MTVKDLYNKYKDYTIMLFGKPLNVETAPFSNLPKDKNMYDCDVIDYKIINDEHGVTDYNIINNTMVVKNRKGYIYAYIK